MRLLLDTHILVWLVLDDRRLTDAQRAALEEPDNELIVGPTVTYELAHLQRNNRIPLGEPIDRLQQLVGFTLVDLPHGIWRAVSGLPDIHRDPLDRLLVAHALIDEMTLITADADIRRYPVACI